MKGVLFEKTGGVEGRLQRALKGNLKETLKGLQRGKGVLQKGDFKESFKEALKGASRLWGKGRPSSLSEDPFKGFKGSWK